MKNSLFFLVLSVLSSVAFASGWSIQNLDTGEISQNPQVQFCQSDWYRLAQNNNCISGDIRQAFKDLQIHDGCDSHVTKTSYSPSGIYLNVHGPVCTQWEPHPEPNCLKSVVKNVPATFKVCSPNEQFFTIGKSQVVPFQEDVRVETAIQKFSNVYYSGDVSVDIYSRRTGVLTIRVDSFKGKLALRIGLSPDQKIPSQGTINLKVINDEILDPLSSNSTSCKAKIGQENYVLVCSGEEGRLVVPSLPVWTLAKGTFGTSIASYSAQDNFAFQNLKTKETLRKNVDYTSLAGLWLVLSENEFSNYCVGGNLSQAKSSLGSYTGLLYGTQNGKLNGKAQILPNGVKFFVDNRVCPEDLVQVSPDDFDCPVKEVIQESSFVLKSCR